MKKWVYWALILTIMLTANLLRFTYSYFDTYDEYHTERSTKADSRIETWYEYFDELKYHDDPRISSYYSLYTIIGSANFDYTPEQQEKVDTLKEMILDELEACGANLEKEN